MWWMCIIFSMKCCLSVGSLFFLNGVVFYVLCSLV